MPKAQVIRVRLSDETTIELPENEVVQVVTAGPSEKAQEGWQRINADKAPALYGKLAKVRATALTPGQHLVTFRGVLTVESARRA
jgi:hypothetical protein